MKKPSPRQVFDDSSAYWAFLTQDSDDDFEGQHFDRKEAGQAGAGVAALNRRQMDGIRNHVKETISAFANKNVEGGLLVLGIAGDGSVKGTDHLTEPQRNSITNFDNLLHHQTAEAKFHEGGIHLTQVQKRYLPEYIAFFPIFFAFHSKMANTL